MQRHHSGNFNVKNTSGGLHGARKMIGASGKGEFNQKK